MHIQHYIDSFPKSSISSSVSLIFTPSDSPLCIYKRLQLPKNTLLNIFNLNTVYFNKNTVCGMLTTYEHIFNNSHHLDVNDISITITGVDQSILLIDGIAIRLGINTKSFDVLSGKFLGVSATVAIEPSGFINPKLSADSNDFYDYLLTACELANHDKKAFACLMDSNNHNLKLVNSNNISTVLNIYYSLENKLSNLEKAAFTLLADKNVHTMNEIRISKLVNTVFKDAHTMAEFKYIVEKLVDILLNTASKNIIFSVGRYIENIKKEFSF